MNYHQVDSRCFWRKKKTFQVSFALGRSYMKNSNFKRKSKFKYNHHTLEESHQLLTNLQCRDPLQTLLIQSVHWHKGQSTWLHSSSGEKLSIPVKTERKHANEGEALNLDFMQKLKTESRQNMLIREPKELKAKYVGENWHDHG